MTTWIVFAVYFAALLLLGELFARLKVRSLDDYLLSSREHGAFVTSASLIATVIGAGSTIGAAGVAYYVGLSAGWYLLSAGPGLVLLAYTLAPALRDLSVYTIPEYIERRYGSLAGLIAAVLGIVGLVLFLSAQFYALGSLLTQLTPLSVRTGTAISSLAVIVYTWRGGNWAVHWSDTIQIVLVVVGIVLAVGFTLERIGGLEVLRQPPAAAGFGELGSSWFHPITREPVSGWAPFALGNTIAAWIVMSTTWHFAMQSTAQRIFSTRDSTVVRRSCLVAAATTLPLAVLFAVVGMGARILYPGLEPPGGREVIEQVRALPALVEGVLDPVTAGVVLAALVAVIMSTCDSALLGSSTLVQKDLLPRVGWKAGGTEGDADELRTGRRLVVVVGLLGLGSALVAPGLVQILEIVAGVYTVALFAPLILGQYWDRASEPGAIASMVASGVVAIGWRGLGFEERSGIHMLNLALPVAFLALAGVSLIGRGEEA